MSDQAPFYDPPICPACSHWASNRDEDGPCDCPCHDAADHVLDLIAALRALAALDTEQIGDASLSTRFDIRHQDILFAREVLYQATAHYMPPEDWLNKATGWVNRESNGE